MKKLTAAFMVIILIFVTGCSTFRPSPQSVVEKTIISIQKLDREIIRSYWKSKNVDTTGIVDQTSELLPLLMENIQYEILDCVENTDTATVKVKVTNLDMQIILTEFLAQVFKLTLEYAFLPEDKRPSDSEITTDYIDLLELLMQRKENPMITTEVEVQLSLTDGAWKIQNQEELFNGVSGGLLQFLEEFSLTLDDELGLELNKGDLLP